MSEIVPQSWDPPERVMTGVLIRVLSTSRTTPRWKKSSRQSMRPGSWRLGLRQRPKRVLPAVHGGMGGSGWRRRLSLSGDPVQLGRAPPPDLPRVAKARVGRTPPPDLPRVAKARVGRTPPPDLPRVAKARAPSDAAVGGGRREDGGGTRRPRSCAVGS